MSTRTRSTRTSLSWREGIFIILGLILMAGIGALGVAGLSSLLQSFAATATKSYWFISRASGVLAYLLLTFSVLWGLMQSGAILRPIIPPLLVLGMHNFLSWAALVMVALHALILLGDGFIKMGLVHLFIPFIAPYRPFWVGLGVIALYLTFALSVSFYVRRHIGQKTFRYFHYSSYLAYTLATLHGLGSGTDISYLPVLFILSAGAVIVLTFWRFSNARRAA
jgi:sulfoxide reductase heme-binding subunit YedZ